MEPSFVSANLTAPNTLPAQNLPDHFQIMQQEIPEDVQQRIEAARLAKEQNDSILEKQKIQLGCDEMQRITDDIIVPTLLEAAKSVKAADKEVEVILLDCESPLDQKLYNLGAKCIVGPSDASSQFALVADPSTFDFAISQTAADGTITESALQFHEVTPFAIEKKIAAFIATELSDDIFKPSSDPTAGNDLTPPFRVQYDDNGNISDVAVTDTVEEALKMGATFAQMFKKEEAITILDSDGNILC